MALTTGGYAGAERTSRELFRWTPPIISPDEQISVVKDMADARSRDMTQNNGYAAGAVERTKDSVVGSQFRLNAAPSYTVLRSLGFKGADEKWAEEFQETVEGRFNLSGDSTENWFDAAGRNTFTNLMRLAVGSYLITGEVLATSEWIRESGRPFRTAIQLISPTRLSNPEFGMNSRTLRNGITLNRYGKPIKYHIRRGFPNDPYLDMDSDVWDVVDATKHWGRKQIIHILDQRLPGQNRAVSGMVSVLKQMKMTSKFNDVVLQNAVIQASVAASIESELPSDLIYQSLGASQTGMSDVLGQYLSAMNTYQSNATNIHLDGASIPTFFPNTKFKVQPLGTPGGMGTNFEESLNRHIASAFGVSYEQYTGDYSKTNYSSARASAAETEKAMRAKKKFVADNLASNVYGLYLEEEVARGNVPLPRGITADDFYNPMVRDALLRCSWIGAARGQIDELKESQAAALRVNNLMGTFESECAKQGLDWREVADQRAREERYFSSKGLTYTLETKKPGTNNAEGSESTNKTGKKSDQESDDE